MAALGAEEPGLGLAGFLCRFGACFGIVFLVLVQDFDALTCHNLARLPEVSFLLS